MVAPFVAKRDTRGIVAQCLQLSDFLMEGDSAIPSGHAFLLRDRYLPDAWWLRVRNSRRTLACP